MKISYRKKWNNNGMCYNQTLTLTFHEFLDVKDELNSAIAKADSDWNIVFLHQVYIDKENYLTLTTLRALYSVLSTFECKRKVSTNKNTILRVSL